MNSENQVQKHEKDAPTVTEATVEPSKLRKRVSYTAKMLGVTMLGVLAVSGPTAAFYDDSPILIPYLKLIQQALKDALGNTLKDGFQDFATDQINKQVEHYTKELEHNMMPGVFRSNDIAAPIARAGVARATGYELAKSAFPITGANTLVNTERALGQLPNSPVIVIQQKNREARNLIQNSRCNPLQAVPVDTSETNIQCTQRERQVAAELLLGVTPPAELPDTQTAGGAIEEAYESARTTMIARKQLSALALSDASNEQKQAMLTAWREALSKPTIEELQQLTADGGVARDALVLQQIIARLQLENYVEDLEIKRLYAVLNAQMAEEDERKVLSPLRRAASN